MQEPVSIEYTYNTIQASDGFFCYFQCVVKTAKSMHFYVQSEHGHEEKECILRWLEEHQQAWFREYCLRRKGQ